MDHTPARILVVDDEPSITEFVSYALQKENYTVDTAGDGEQALTLIEQKPCDLYILDIMLPGIDGYELCRRIRASYDTPILFLSARDGEVNKIIGLELGADDYLAKPFGIRELIARTRAFAGYQFHQRRGQRKRHRARRRRTHRHGRTWSDRSYATRVRTHELPHA